MTASSQPRVIILTGASCPWCNRVKEYLREKKFRFREVNVEKDPEGVRELKRRNIMGVPVVLINNQSVVGFDRAKIDKTTGHQVRKGVLRCRSNHLRTEFWLSQKRSKKVKAKEV